MNLLLFASEGDLRHIKPTDPRLAHLRNVLKMQAGQRMYAGVLGGRRAWATILRDDPQGGMFTEPEWEANEPPAPLPVRVIAGLPRPQTARRILFEAAVFGVTQLDFFQAQKGEPSYAQSSLWSTPEWQERLLLGAEQACVTALPSVRHFADLESALAARCSEPLQNQSSAGALKDLPATVALHPHTGTGTTAEPAATTQPETSSSAKAVNVKLALDVYEAIAPLSHLLPPGKADGRWLTLAIGAERGWSAQERTLLTQYDFLLTHIGERVLRAETAFVAALALVSDKLLYPEP